MASALEIASLYGLLALDNRMSDQLKEADKDMDSFAGKLDKTGNRLTNIGGKVMQAVAPIAIGLGLAVGSAVSFDEAMTNIQAVTQKTDEDMEDLSDEVLRMGKNSRAGPQAVAQSMYDIVGGVNDASTHMDILAQSIRTSEAGSADLGATTQALISVMNSYKFAADDASYASDVLTRTVGMGVGSMDEFAAALPQITGLANSLGISFGDLGGMTAYLTTQGNSASGAVTQLGAMMTALLNPNETMKKGLADLGFTSGQAAIEALGLTGAYQALAGTQTANTDGMAKMTGSVEALRGVTAFAGPEFDTFATTFTEGINGATAAAQAVQLGSTAAQFDLLKSSLEATGIKIGEALLPAINDLIAGAQPLIDQVADWIGKNPSLRSRLKSRKTRVRVGR